MTEKNAAAVEMAKRRWAGTTAKERQDFAAARASEIKPEAALARAKKAAKTRKRNAKLKKSQESEKISSPEK